MKKYFCAKLKTFISPAHSSLEIKMAKNTSSSAFRKIDVDQYNEDNFKEEDADQGVGGPDENEVTTLLNQYPFQNI